MEDVEKRVKRVISEQLCVHIHQVTNDAHFVDDLGADSLDQVEVLMALEEEFDCDIPDEDAANMVTVQQVIDYLRSRNPESPGEVLR